MGLQPRWKIWGTKIVTDKTADKPVIANPMLYDGSFSKQVPDGDNRERLVCNDCGFVNYQNPKIVAGVVAVHDNKVLLCKRAIEPRYGFWTLPAGFMEEGESVEDGALREAHEEASANLKIGQLLSVYSIKRISQVQIFYTAEFDGDPEFAPGVESTEVALFDWDDIPWEHMAFPSAVWALKQYRSVWGQPAFAPFTNPPEGSTDADMAAFFKNTRAAD